MLTATLSVLLSISLPAGLYAFAEGHRSTRTSIAWGVSLISSLILAAILLTSYFRLVFAGFPMDW